MCLMIFQFYANCMDVETIEALGKLPLEPYWGQVSNVQGLDDFMFISGLLQANGIGALLSVGVVADSMNPGYNVGEFDQGGFALPDRSLYFDNDLRSQYVDYSTTLHLYFLFLRRDTVTIPKSKKRGSIVLSLVCSPLHSFRYLTHMTNLFGLMLDDPHAAATAAQNVLTVETILANASLPGDQIRDPFSVYANLQATFF